MRPECAAPDLYFYNKEVAPTHRLANFACIDNASNPHTPAGALTRTADAIPPATICCMASPNWSKLNP